MKLEFTVTSPKEGTRVRFFPKESRAETPIAVAGEGILREGEHPPPFAFA